MQEPYNPQSLNRYTYCFNNPLIYVDPSGYSALESIKEWADNILKFMGFDKFGEEKEKKTDELCKKDKNEDNTYICPEITANDKKGGGDVSYPPNLPQGGNYPLEMISNPVEITDTANIVRDGTATGMKLTSGSFSIMKTDGTDYFRHYKPTLSRPHGWTGSGFVKTFNFSKVGNMIGKGSVAISLTVGLANIYQGYLKDGKSIGHNTGVEVAKTIGGIGGGTIGAVTGAMIGFYIGGVSAIPGGIIGGVIGAHDGSVFMERCYNDYIRE